MAEIIEKEMAYKYRMTIDGIPAKYAGLWAGVSSDKEARWGDVLPALAPDQSGEGTLQFTFKWEPLEGGLHTLAVAVFEDPIRSGITSMEDIEMTEVMRVRVQVHK